MIAQPLPFFDAPRGVAPSSRLDPVEVERLCDLLYPYRDNTSPGWAGVGAVIDALHARVERERRAVPTP